MKEWKYRFKRGLASILTVGMIASGVNAATCLPVYAVETSIYTEDELKEDVQQIYDELVKQILEMVNGDDTTAEMKEAEFNVSIKFENQNNDSDKYNVVKEELEKNVPDIVSRLLKEHASELFWYDQLFELNGNDSYSCEGTHIKNHGEKVGVKFTFRFAVKDEYKNEDDKENPVSVDIQKVRNTKSALEDPELKKASEQVYAKLKEQILQMFNAEAAANMNEAKFVVFLDSENPEKSRVLKEEVEKNVKDIMSRLLGECSNELFWYDSSYNKLNNGSYDWVSSYYKDDPHVYFTLKFAVKEDYRSESDKNNISSINITKIQGSKTTVDAILKAYNKEQGMSDYEILCGFREALSKYPNDDVTKAFQYLCDRTEFISDTTKCYTVTGKKEDKDYTWNIVSIGGQSYLVDMPCALENSNEFFLVGAQGQHKPEDGYTIANGKKYVPDPGQPGLLMLSDLHYKQDQSDFRFVSPLKLSGVVGNEDLQIQVEGNVKGSTVSFESSDPTIATVSTAAWGDGKCALVHLLKAKEAPVDVEIRAIASETDSHAEKIIVCTVTVAGGNSTENPGGNTGGNGSGGNSGGNGDGSGVIPTEPVNPGTVGGGGGPIGGSGSGIGGSLGGNAVRSIELLAQTDFTFDVGYAKVVKTVGTDDFTIEATGQVAGSDVTYESSDLSVATVDANSGKVHIVGSGNAKIIATASETDIHKSATAEYKLEVVKAEGSIYY